MTPEEKALLESTYTLVKENNDLLRGIRRRARWGVAWRITYWVLIIGVSLGAFYFIQPYVDAVRDLTGRSNDSASSTLDELLR
jgi:hypothetical protein